MKRISVFMDVEDPINPLADDAALDFARLFTEVGVRGSFCLTGEKCRTLIQRRRHDVIEAFKDHCLGLHTDTHSQHPTTMELLADLEYVEGCKVAFNTEAKGDLAFREAFDRRPSFWGGAGNTWSPEITYALSGLGIPAYSYALTSIPNLGVHRFNGVMALPQAVSVGEDDWMDEAGIGSQVDAAIQSIRTIDQPWMGVFVGHPTRFRYRQFWDFGYAAGKAPAAPEYAEPTDDQNYQIGKSNLKGFLGRLKEEFEVIGVDEMLDLNWKFEPASSHALAYFKGQTPKTLRQAAHWPIHKPNLDVENIVVKTLDLANTLEIAKLGD